MYGDEEVVEVGKKDNDDMDLGEGESWGEEQTSSLGETSIFCFSQLSGEMKCATKSMQISV